MVVGLPGVIDVNVELAGAMIPGTFGRGVAVGRTGGLEAVGTSAVPMRSVFGGS